MGIYDSIEGYLPEMTAVRSSYDTYLKEHNLSKTAEERLFDYLALISDSYTFNREKMVTEFSTPKIEETLQKDKRQCIYSVISPLSERMRYHEMKDLAEFSPLITRELYEERDNVDVKPEYAWIYKRFPAHKELFQSDPEMVRYALNVKPGIGLFRKLDNLCLKHNAFDYKVICEKRYNQRTDPIIIYAHKDNQEEMLKDLETLIRPYRRKDEYDMIGYSNFGHGIFIADEAKKEDMLQLKYDILTKDECDVFIHPVEDEDEQDDREYELKKSIYSSRSTCPVKCELIDWIDHHSYNRAVSSAQYQAAKMIVNAYNKTRENDLSKEYTKQDAR